ncbi:MULTISPECIES: 2-oxo acid dehydrogenase subunit E2 [Halomonadaceae]|jgi:2-oxoisovalerate dehydrogenase E2 component (dihydrolipoyl transacylase)|uniref:Dihydrolipoamide acetyltransferase component of pyruvate dehydrogenase complex n=1 Tax=Vreelandella aquamarina TaxID=77097 RepID=A0A6F8SU84_9GAMM|nr:MULTISPECIES: 2-oxo acid dehydrogenase subunit E2 [Halomonas]MCF2911820.1 2-oxo acid dehydrogenase subunit E2 [Halomonas sp. Cn5-12]BCA91984.1 dihydrolipoamide acetyltransferase component of pyruvate dehydrogenase complex [Halomonas meridiana]
MSDFLLPDIGEGIVECEVVEWRVAEGDTIEEDQPIVEVMTDKALVEITAPEAGTVTKLYVAQGKIAKVHAPLYAYQAAGQMNRDTTATEQAPPAPPSSHAVAADENSPPPKSQAVTPAAAGKVPASPAVRRLVREHSLALSEISGSGKDGRVLKEDVLAHLNAPAVSHQTASVSMPSSTGLAPSKVEPLRGVRAVMAKRMVEAASSIPHFHYGEEIDVTELLALRERLKPQVEAKGERLTLMPFFMKAMALAVAETPIINAQLNSEANELSYYDQCNIGMAVDGKAGLLVPNVKGVEGLTLFEIAKEVGRLTNAAREGRVEQADLKGGTISISNIGALGGTYAAPIINAPEAAIVAIGKTQWLPRFDEHGAVQRRAILTVTWAGDHRFIDGGTIARFCNAWKGFLEAPESMLLHLA